MAPLATGAVALLGLACGSSSLTGEPVGYCPPPGHPGTLTAVHGGSTYPMVWGPLGSCRLLFTTDDLRPPYPLWITDGTPAGTVQVADDDAGGAVTAQLGDVAFFGPLWRTDGTAAGTFTPDPMLHTGSSPADAAVLGGGLLFDGSEDGADPDAPLLGLQLWRTDGTGQGTFLLDVVVPGAAQTLSGPNGFVQAGDLAYFDDGTGNLWRSDGTAAGTFELAPLHKLAWTALGATLVFVGTDAQSNTGVWRTDGTDGGTSLLQPLGVPTSGASFYGPRDLFGMVTLGERVILLASSRPPQPALENAAAQPRVGPPIDAVWTTDGTPTGTTLVVELPQATGSASFLAPFVAGDLAYFVSSSAGVAPDFSTLWRTDGTATGTVSLAPFWSTTYADIVAGGGRVFFSARTPEAGAELWQTDGDPADTGMVRDINPGAADSLGVHGGPRKYAFVGGELVFQADDGVHGEEVWVTDGTEAGTHRLADIFPTSQIIAAGPPLVMNGAAFFTGATEPGQFSLWRYVPQ